MHGGGSVRRTVHAGLVLGGLLVSGWAASACGEPPNMPSDAGGFDAARDDGGGSDATTSAIDTGPRDGGPRPMPDTGVCASGQHRCGAGCIADQPNEPERGCRLGCGEACAEPDMGGTAACSDAGTCSVECTPPYHLVDGACECTPRSCMDMGASCGSPNDGCGHILNCGSCTGGSCVEGSCRCDPDRFEPNDVHTSQTRPQGTLIDSSNTRLTVENGTLDDAADVDWYRFTVTDNTDGGSPVVTVTLSQIPSGSQFEVATYFTCDSGDPMSSTCREGTVDTLVGKGCVAPRSGSTRRAIIDCECGNILNQSGVLFVRVSASQYGAAACTPYLLTVSVD